MSVHNIVPRRSDKPLRVRRLIFLAVWIVVLSGVIGACSSSMRGCSRPTTLEPEELRLDLHLA